MKSSYLCSYAWSTVVLVIALGIRASAQSNANAVDSSSADPKTLLLLALEKGGGPQLSAIQDFVARGQITYGALAPSSRRGRVTLMGQGSDRFRMDSEFDDGAIASWTISSRKGQYKSVGASKIGEIASYNTINEGWLTLPYMRLTTALSDPTVELHYLGLQSFQGTSAHRIRVIRHLPKDEDPQDMLSELTTADYYLSAADLSIIGIADSVHPNRAAVGIDSGGHVLVASIPRVLSYGDFQLRNGIAVPFSVTEVVRNQPMWTVQLSDVAFNIGRTDSDFVLQ